MHSQNNEALGASVKGKVLWSEHFTARDYVFRSLHLCRRHYSEQDARGSRRVAWLCVAKALAIALIRTLALTLTLTLALTFVQAPLSIQ